MLFIVRVHIVDLDNDQLSINHRESGIRRQLPTIQPVEDTQIFCRVFAEGQGLANRTLYRALLPFAQGLVRRQGPGAAAPDKAGKDQTPASGSPSPNF